MAEPLPDNDQHADDADDGQKPTGDVPEGQVPTDDGDDDAGDPKSPRTYSESYVRQLRRESSGYRTRLAEVEARLQEFADRDKSDSEKQGEKLVAAETRATEAESRLIRYEVAAERGLDMQAAGFLVGTSRDEIEASADELAKLLKDKGKPPSFDGGARTPAPEEKPPGEAHNDFLLRALGRQT